MSGYDPTQYPPFAVTVDLVVLTVREDTLLGLTIRRLVNPYRGRRALPGGFVRIEEDLETAAYRELAEETGIDRAPAHLEQLATYGAPDRDPRMRVVTVAYLALAPSLPDPVAGGDAGDARWSPVHSLLEDPGVLAFDHHRILSDGVERARAKLEYTTLATAFCPAEFTIAELRRVYDAVWDVELDPRNFHRKATGSAGFLTDIGATTNRSGGRPAQLFRAGPATLLSPPIFRPRPGAGTERGGRD